MPDGPPPTSLTVEFHPLCIGRHGYGENKTIYFIMRELLYNAAKHYKRGKALSDRGDVRGALVAYADALRDLQAVKPQRMRDVLLAQVHLSRYQVALAANTEDPLRDLRLGYSYARTTREPAVQELAEALWHEHLKQQSRAFETLSGD